MSLLTLSLSLRPQSAAADLEPYALMQAWLTGMDQDVSAQADPSGYGDPEYDVGFKLRKLKVEFR